MSGALSRGPTASRVLRRLSSKADGRALLLLTVRDGRIVAFMLMVAPEGVVNMHGEVENVPERPE